MGEVLGAGDSASGVAGDEGEGKVTLEWSARAAESWDRRLTCYAGMVRSQMTRDPGEGRWRDLYSLILALQAGLVAGLAQEEREDIHLLTQVATDK